MLKSMTGHAARDRRHHHRGSNPTVVMGELDDLPAAVPIDSGPVICAQAGGETVTKDYAVSKRHPRSGKCRDCGHKCVNNPKRR